MQRLPRRPAWLLLAVVVVLAVAACGAAGGSASTSQDDAATSATTAPSAPVAADRLLVRDDLVDPEVVPWRSWRTADSTTLEFTVTAGPADCYGAQPEVVESDTEVKVRLRVGRLPEAAEAECSAIAREAVVPVQLAEPLGGRTVQHLT